jgi:hypothetical protein
MPTLLIWGDRDGVIPFDHARTAHAAMPGSRLEVFKNSGHFPHHSDPRRFLQVLYDFLSGTQAASWSSDDWRMLLQQGRVPASQGPGATRTAESLATSVRSGT